MSHWTILAAVLGLLLGFAIGVIYAQKGNEAIDRCVRNAHLTQPTDSEITR